MQLVSSCSWPSPDCILFAALKPIEKVYTKWKERDDRWIWEMDMARTAEEEDVSMPIANLAGKQVLTSF